MTGKIGVFGWAVGVVFLGAACASGDAGDASEPGVWRGALAEDWQLCGDALSYYDDSVGPIPEACQPLQSDPKSLWNKIRNDLENRSRPWINKSSDPEMMDGEITLRFRFAPGSEPDSVEELEELFAQQDRIIDFIGKQKDPGTSRAATREEYLRVLQGLIESLDDQSEGLREKSQQHINTMRQRLLALGTDDEQIALVTEVSELADLEALFDATELSLSSLTTPAAEAIQGFSSLKARQATLSRKALDLSKRASKTTAATLPALQTELTNWSNTESEPAADLMLDASRVVGQLGSTYRDFDARIERFEAVLSAGSITKPKFGDLAQTTHSGIASYAMAWEAFVGETFEQLQRGLKLRSEALQQAAADEATRVTFAKTQHLQAATDFLNEANQRSSQLLALPPKTVSLKAMVLAGKLDEVSALLELEPLCVAEKLAVESWRESGCVALRRDFARGRTFAEKTVPALIRANITLLRRAGVPADQLTPIESELAQNRVRAAAVLSDAVILANDTLPFIAAEAPIAPPPGVAAKAIAPDGVAAKALALMAAPAAESVGTITSAITKECAARRCQVICDIQNARALLRRRGDYQASQIAEEAALQALETDLLALLDKPLSKITEAAVRAVLDAHTDVDQRVRDNLLAVFTGLKESLAELEAEVKAARKSLGEQATRLEQLSSQIAGLPKFDPSKAEQFELSLGPVPDVDVPAVSTPAPVEGAAAAYVAYGDLLTQRLSTSVVAGKVSDRSAYLGELSAWQQNSSDLRLVIGRRAASHPVETRALAAANARVTTFNTVHASSTGWFLDAKVSGPTRGMVEKLVKPGLPHAGRALYEALSANSSTLSASERKDVETLVAVLSRATASASLRHRADNAAKLSKFLAQLATALRPGKLAVTPGALADLAKVINGRELGGAGRAVDAAEQLRLGTALGLSAELWRTLSYGARTGAAATLAAATN